MKWVYMLLLLICLSLADAWITSLTDEKPAILKNNAFHWTFKDLKRTSKPHLIYRDMLEKTFSKKIIDSKRIKNYDTVFYISENKRNLYDYCLEHCKAI